MSGAREQADQVALARDGADAKLSEQASIARAYAEQNVPVPPSKPPRFRSIKPTSRLSPMGRQLLSAHVTIASRWKVLWWLK